MPTVKERLTHLLALAAEGPAQRAALVGELADLVFDWPADCPAQMRPPVEALLTLMVREADDAMRARLAARLGGHPELPLGLINEFYLVASPRVRREILLRNEIAEEGGSTACADGACLIAAARDPAVDFPSALAALAGVPRPVAQHVLADASGEALAVLCKGTHAGRAAFSVLALLKTGAALEVYDSVPQHAAERLVEHWRLAQPQLRAAAAE